VFYYHPDVKSVFFAFKKYDWLILPFSVSFLLRVFVFFCFCDFNFVVFLTVKSNVMTCLISWQHVQVSVSFILTNTNFVFLLKWHFYCLSFWRDAKITTWKSGTNDIQMAMWNHF
jgi:hypothetical protein